MLILLMACGLLSTPSPVPELPEGAATVTVAGEGVRVDGTEVVTFEVLEVDPVDAVDPSLREALEGRPAAWLSLPAELPWYRARKLVGSASAAGVAQRWLSIEGGPAAPVMEGEPPRSRLQVGCASGPVPWTGVAPRVTVALQRSTDGTWALATARFVPVVDGVPTEGLPATCLAPMACSALYQGDDAEACEAGRAEGARSRVTLGDEVGCLLPLIRKGGDLAMWEESLPRVLRRLGLDEGPTVVVSPEARIRMDVVLATLDAFAAVDAPGPTLGRPLVEGNDGAPLCQAEVRDAASLRRAAARYAGALMASRETP